MTLGMKRRITSTYLLQCNSTPTICLQDWLVPALQEHDILSIVTTFFSSESLLFESLTFSVPVIVWGSDVNALAWKHNTNNSMLSSLLQVTPLIIIMPEFTTFWSSIRFIEDGMAFANSHSVCSCIPPIMSGSKGSFLRDEK